MGLAFVGTIPLGTGSPTQGLRTTALKLDASDRVLSLRELLTLLAIGCVERNPGPSDDFEPFYSSIQPLKIWLDQGNFYYKIAAYQRGYEWGEPQISRLLEDLQQLMCGEYKVIKLSEVFVFQEAERDRAEFQSRLNSEWYKDCQRGVEVVDGQQRITTFILIYAVIQYWLFRIQKDLSSEERGPAEAKAESLAGRFTMNSPGFNKPLVLCRDQENAQAYPLLENQMFQNDCRLGKYLDKDEETVFQPEHQNALQISRWISEKLKEEKNHSEKLKWLTKLLVALDTRVYWTTTMTTDAALALTTFVTHNSSASMVPLNQIDVIKVAIVSNIKDNSNDRKRSIIVKDSLEAWNCAKKILAGVIRKYDENTEPTELPFANLLLTKEINNDKDASLMVDLLDFIRKILVCDSASKPSKMSKKLGLEEFYGHLRALYLKGGKDEWDPVGFMEKIRKYALALAILLKQEGLGPSLQLTISNLLGFPKDCQNWRPLGIAIIGALNHGFKIDGEEYPKHFPKLWHALAEIALKAIELLVTCFAAMEFQQGWNVREIKEDVYNGLILWVYHFEDGMKALCEGLKDQVEKRLKKYIPCDVNKYIIEKLYSEDLYTSKKGKEIGRSVLLMLEHQYRLPNVDNNAGLLTWKKELTVEHILPQDPENKELTEIDFPDKKRHIALHLLGNLALLTRRDNSALSNKYWRTIAGETGKRESLQTEGYDNSIELLKRLRSEDYEQWRWEEFLKRHNELFKLLAKKFGFDDKRWEEHEHEWVALLEEQCTVDGPIPGNCNSQPIGGDQRLKWLDSLKSKIGDKHGEFLKLLADAIYNHNTGGVAWTNRDSDAVRRVIHNEFPHIDLENDLDHDTIVNARRNYDLMYMYHIATGKYSKLKKETRVFLDAKLEGFITKEECSFKGNRALSAKQREEFRQSMLAFCEELDAYNYAKCFAILDKFGSDIIKSREQENKRQRELKQTPGEKWLADEIKKAIQSNNKVLVKQYLDLGLVKGDPGKYLPGDVMTKFLKEKSLDNEFRDFQATDPLLTKWEKLVKDVMERITYKIGNHRGKPPHSHRTVAIDFIKLANKERIDVMAEDFLKRLKRLDMSVECLSTKNKWSTKEMRSTNTNMDLDTIIQSQIFLEWKSGEPFKNIPVTSSEGEGSSITTAFQHYLRANINISADFLAFANSEAMWDALKERKSPGNEVELNKYEGGKSSAADHAAPSAVKINVFDRDLDDNYNTKEQDVCQDHWPANQ